MGTVIYLDHFRPQEPDLPPNTLCGGLVTPYVVDPSAPPKARPIVHRCKNWQDGESHPDACVVFRGRFGLKIKPSAFGTHIADGPCN